MRERLERDRNFVVIGTVVEELCQHYEVADSLKSDMIDYGTKLLYLLDDDIVCVRSSFEKYVRKDIIKKFELKEKVSQNMTVEDLQYILQQLPPHMEVVIPVIDLEDRDHVTDFRTVRTAGVLRNEYEPNLVLCIATSSNGSDISAQIKNSGTICTKVLF